MQTHTQTHLRRPRPRYAFTIVELIVVIAIIFVLAGLILVAMRGTMTSAGRVESAGALRQMMTAFNTYTKENEGRILPGYVSSNALTSMGLQARLELGEKLLPCAPDELHCDLSPYVWRLAPYMDHAMLAFAKDYRSGSLDQTIGSELGRAAPALGTESRGPLDIGIAHFPAYGMNTYFIGGDDVHAPPPGPGTPIAPWVAGPSGVTPELAIERMSQAKQPSRLLVFAPTVHAEYATPTFDPNSPPFSTVKGGLQVFFGYAEARPPYAMWDDVANRWADQQWQLDADGRAEILTANFHGPATDVDGGVPYARWGELLPIANMDGSTEMVTLAELLDMGRWSATRLTDQNFSDLQDPVVP